MRTILEHLTVQSLPTQFAATLRQRILDVGTACDTASPWYFDATARRLGELVASSHHTAIYDGRRRMLLTPPEDYIPALDLAELTVTDNNYLIWIDDPHLVYCCVPDNNVKDEKTT